MTNTAIKGRHRPTAANIDEIVAQAQEVGYNAHSLARDAMVSYTVTSRMFSASHIPKESTLAKITEAIRARRP